MLIPVTDPSDPRLADYVALRDSSLRRHLESEQGLFIAEGEKVIRRAIEAPVLQIIELVRTVLDVCPPELAGDVLDRGITLTGGGALLRGLDERMRHELGVPVHVADDPLRAVARGAGRCVEEFSSLERVLVDNARP